MVPVGAGGHVADAPFAVGDVVAWGDGVVRAVEPGEGPGPGAEMYTVRSVSEHVAELEGAEPQVGLAERVAELLADLRRDREAFQRAGATAADDYAAFVIGRLVGR